MIIGFLRHAEAEHASKSDFDRKLTPKGIGQAEKAARFCLRNGLLPDLIMTSPVVRARQTAGIFAKLTGCDLVEEHWLACGMSPQDCLKEISAILHKDFVLLVGHEPDFSRAISHLIGLPDSSALNIRKASLTAVEVADFRAGCGQLQFSVPVRLM
ncbi:MAG: histidine phosphatase family protein [Verrucomicrobiae bacterium]